jgi:TolB-like protein
MKSALRLLALIAPALAFAAPTGPATSLQVAVFDFQADGNVDGQPNAGRSVARLLAEDISGLAPLGAIDRRAIEERLPDRKLDLVDPSAPGDAREIGRSLGAGTLVTGRFFRTGAEIIIAAKVVSAETGQTLGTMVKGDRSKPIADLISQLSLQVGAIAQVQLGLPTVSWSPAAIVGIRKRGSFLANDEVACVMDVDGRLVPDETEHWDQKLALLPGLHEIYVRYYDGSSTAGHSFVLYAKPGASYAVGYERKPNMNPRLWIQDQATHKAVTGIAEASTGDPEHSTGSFGMAGIWSESDNPDYVRPPAKHSR